MLVYWKYFLYCWPSSNLCLSLLINSLGNPLLLPLRLISNCFHDYFLALFSFVIVIIIIYFFTPTEKLHTYYIHIYLLTFYLTCFIIYSFSQSVYTHCIHTHTHSYTHTYNGISSNIFIIYTIFRYKIYYYICVYY